MASNQYRVDRALTAPPLRNNTESSLVATCSLLLNLTRAESRALVQLLKHEHVTREELHAAIAGDDDPVTVPKVVDVIVGRLRRKLTRRRIKIVTIREQGFRLDPAARDRIRKILAEYGADIVSAATPPVSLNLKDIEPDLFSEERT
jgi:DNA-binding response OmpR family regulator